MRTLAQDLDEEPAEMPMTPLIDMVFLLLSFFVFATQLRDELPGPKVELPQHGGPPADIGGQGESWRVEIARDGAVTLTKPAAAGGVEQHLLAAPQTVAPEQFAAALSPLLPAGAAQLPAIALVVDKEVPYERLSATLAGLRLAGLTKFKLTHRLNPPQP